MSCLVSRLRPERAIILEGGQVREGQVRACHGLEADQVLSGAPISLTILQDVCNAGQPLLLGDARAAPQYKDCWSLLLSGIRSVLCVPFLNAAGAVQGVLYADSRTKTGCFGPADLELAVLCARHMEAQLYRGDTRSLESALPPVAVAPAPVADLPRSRSRAAPRVVSRTPELARVATARPAAASAADPRRLRLAEGAKVTLLRSLATCVDCGLSLSSAVELLGSGGPPLDSVCNLLAAHLYRGQSLSEAMAHCPAAFAPTEVGMVRVAEHTGTLHRVLPRLAQHQEKLYSTRQKLIGSMVYPAFTLAFCLVVLVILPPYVLEGQFEFIRSSGQPVPWFTQALMNVSTASRSWQVWLGAAVVVGPLLRFVARNWRRPEWQRRLWRALLSVPGLGRALVCYGACRLARCLALMMEIGFPVLEALPLAAAASSNPLLAERAPFSVEALKEGASMATSLKHLQYLPTGFMPMLVAGDESGKTPEVLQWLAEFFEREFEAALDSAVAMVEPMILLGVGTLVGLTVIATMLPMVQAIATL